MAYLPGTENPMSINRVTSQYTLRVEDTTLDALAAALHGLRDQADVHTDCAESTISWREGTDAAAIVTATAVLARLTSHGDARLTTGLGIHRRDVAVEDAKAPAA